MRRLPVIALICGSAAVAVVQFLLPTDSVTSVLVGGFWALIAVGTIIRVVRAPRRARLRAGIAPFVGAAEASQELHLGSPGLQKSMLNAAREQERRHTESQSESRQE
jgi:hypothetical protein